VDQQTGPTGSANGSLAPGQFLGDQRIAGLYRFSRIYRNMQPAQRLPYVWDYDLDRNQFREILEGRRTKGRLNQDWAVRRLLEYAPYDEIIHLIGYKKLVENWPRWRGRIRSKSRVRGFNFLVRWLPEKHPELLRG